VKEIISKRLLSKVLQVEVIGVYTTNDTEKCFDLGLVCGKNDVVIEDTVTVNIYNIHELAYKCKEWCYLDGYEIVSRIRKPDTYRDDDRLDYGYEVYKQGDLIEYQWWIDTEPGAVFKACQWILDNRAD